MGTREQISEAPEPEEQLRLRFEEILASRRDQPPNTDWPRYWCHHLRSASIFAVTSSLRIIEGAVTTASSGERVDIVKEIKHTSVLGIKKPQRVTYTLTKWDQTEGHHKLEIDPEKGRVEIESRARDSRDKGVMLPVQKMSFERGAPEYTGSINSALALFEVASEAG